MNRLSFQFVTGIVLLAAVAIVTAAGLLAYRSLSGSVQSIEQATRPDPHFLEVKELLNGLYESERSVKTFTFASDTSVLRPFYGYIESLDSNLDHLRESHPTKEFSHFENRLETLILGKLGVLKELLALRKDARPGNEISNIRKRITTSDKDGRSDMEAKQSGLLKKLFENRKSDAMAVPSTPQGENLLREIDSQLRSLDARQSAEEKLRSERETELAKTDSVLSAGLRVLESDIEKYEKAQMTESANRARSAASYSNRIILAFSIAASLLMLTVLFMIFIYVRRNNRHREMMQLAKEEAENHALERERFAASISHEIRTPMHAVIGFTDQLLQEPHTDGQNVKLKIVRNSAEHMLQVVNSVLDFARLGSGKVVLDNAPFQLIRETREVCQLMKYQADAKGIHMHLEVAPDVPAAILGDALRYRQILLNLLGNAVKFTQEGSVTVELKSLAQNNRQHLLQIKVSDTGVGVPAEKTARIFDAFEQASVSTQQKFGGTGLGLAITKMLVELQGGSIELNPAIRRGAEFIVTLPCEETSFSEPLREELASHQPQHLFQGKKVLIADDEPYNRLLLSAMLKKWGFIFEEVVEGAQALNRAVNGRFDLLLLDLKMPHRNGLEVTKEIRSNPDPSISAIPIIGLTAAARVEREACEKAGMNFVLEKPFREQDLFHCVYKLLGPKVSVESAKPEMKSNAESNGGAEAVDLGYLKSVAPGDDRFWKEMLEVFIRSLTQATEEFRHAKASGKKELAADTAHRLIPSCRSLGVSRMHQLLVDIETESRKEKPNGNWEQMILQFCEEAGDLQAYLRRLVEEELIEK